MAGAAPTIYDIGLVFYGVLAALALALPLTAFAQSVALAPQGRGFADWTQRLLTITLLVQAAVWLHDLAVAIERTDTRRNPGLYGTAVLFYWCGVLMVVILEVLGAAVTRGTTAFLAASLAYLGWSVLFSAVAAHQLGQRLRTSPPTLVRVMREQRAAAQRGEAADLHNDPVAVVAVWEAAAGLIILGGLALWASNEPGSGWQFALALTWLLLVVSSIVCHYRTQPESYGV